MLPSAMRLLNCHYRTAHALALSIVEAKARRILQQHPNLHEFVMAMGAYTFTNANDDSVDYAYLEPFDRFMDICKSVALLHCGLPYLQDHFCRFEPLLDGCQIIIGRVQIVKLGEFGIGLIGQQSRHKLTVGRLGIGGQAG